MSSISTSSQAARKKRTSSTYFLAFVPVIAMLIVCCLITKRSDPNLFDQHGKPVAAAPAHESFAKGDWMRT